MTTSGDEVCVLFWLRRLGVGREMSVVLFRKCAGEVVCSNLDIAWPGKYRLFPFPFSLRALPRVAMKNARLILRLIFRLAVCVALAMGPGGSCASAETVRFRGETMGTYYSIAIDGADESQESEIRAKVDECLAEVNRQMSTWDPDSEISRFNQSDSTDWFSVSSEFAKVVEESLRIHRLTEGAFDPTVSPLVDLWGFGSKQPERLPSDEEIAAAKQQVGMERIEVRMMPPAIRKNKAGVALNLSAIAKGYGVDQVASLLASLGFPSHIVDIGGENRAGGLKSTGMKWRVGIESPLDSAEGPHRVVELVNLSVATSGDYRNFFEFQGVRYSHVINPLTGKPVEQPPASITVLSESCMTADAIATALMVMGTERGLTFSQKHGLSVLFLDVVENPVSVGNHVRETGSGSLVSVTPLSAPTSGSPKTSDADKRMPFIAALAIFLLAVLGMSVGVLLRNRAIKGSCGGLASMSGQDGKSICELCTVPKEKCQNPDRFQGPEEESCDVSPASQAG